jgi:ribose transport system substrate-binding protein
MKRKSNLSLAGGVLVAAGLLLVAAGCGSSTSSEDAAPTETVAVEETVEVDEVSAAQAIVDQYGTPPTEILQTIPLTGEVVTDRPLVFMQCELPACQVLMEGTKVAAEAMGWNFKVINVTNTDATTILSGLTEALTYNPIATIVTGFPQAFWAEKIPEYEKAGSMIVPMEVGVVTPTSPAIESVVAGVGKVPVVVKGAGGGLDHAAEGVVIANYIIANSNAEAHVLVQDTPDYDVLSAMAVALKKEMAEKCQKCVVTSLDSTLPQIGAGEVISSVISELQKDRSIKWLAGSFLQFFDGVEVAMEAAGITDVKILGSEPSVSNLQSIKDGKWEAAMGSSIDMRGWLAVDIIARNMLGMEIPSEAIGEPMMLFTTSNVVVAEAMPYPADFPAQFKKLWARK